MKTNLVPETDEWQVEALGKSHIRDQFDCGIPELNFFIRTQARQQHDKHIGKTFVASRRNEKQVLAFYTLSLGSVKFSELPPQIQKSVPKYPIPAVRLGRLAVDLSIEGKGLGRLLLAHAFKKIVEVATTQIGAVVVVVDAKNDSAKSFYEKYGFVTLQEQSHTLCLPIATLLRTALKE